MGIVAPLYERTIRAPITLALSGREPVVLSLRTSGHGLVPFKKWGQPRTQFFLALPLRTSVWPKNKVGAWALSSRSLRSATAHDPF